MPLVYVASFNAHDDRPSYYAVRRYPKMPRPSTFQIEPSTTQFLLNQGYRDGDKFDNELFDPLKELGYFYDLGTVIQENLEPLPYFEPRESPGLSDSERLRLISWLEERGVKKEMLDRLRMKLNQPIQHESEMPRNLTEYPLFGLYQLCLEQDLLSCLGPDAQISITAEESLGVDIVYISNTEHVWLWHVLDIDKSQITWDIYGSQTQSYSDLAYVISTIHTVMDVLASWIQKFDLDIALPEGQFPRIHISSSKYNADNSQGTLMDVPPTLGTESGTHHVETP